MTQALPETPPAASPPTRGATRRPRLFASVWRWHFYAGLLSIPVIMLLGISGIVYLFKPQIDAVAYHHLRTVTPATQRVSYAAQQDAVLKAFPKASVTQLAPPPAANRATEFDITTAAGDTKRVYVNPYTGRVQGDRNPGKSLTTLALDMHGMLLTNRFLDAGGMWGDRIIELAASWALVLVVSGLYLWWPRGRKQRRSFRQALIPRWNAKSRRTRWRDLHAVTGVLFGFVTLFFLITGLAWAGIWGAKIWSPVTQKLGSSYPAGTYDGASSGKVADLVKNGKAAWAAGELPLANSAAKPTSDATQAAQLPTPAGGAAAAREPAGKPGHTGHEGHLTSAGLSAITAGRTDIQVRSEQDGHAGHTHADTILWDPSKGAPIDAIIGRAQRLGFPAGFTISYPGDTTGTYMVSRFPDADVAPNAHAGSERIAYLDQYTALPVGQYAFGQFGALAKATDFGIALHEGRQWGLVNQLLTLLGTLALMFSCASAIVMWRKRKPKGIGAPRRQPNRKLGFGVVAITLAMGALFPMLGASILVLLLLDFVIIRRVPPLARALGAA